MAVGRAAAHAQASGLEALGVADGARLREGLAHDGDVREGRLRDRRHGGGAAARPQGHGRGRGGRRGDRRAATRARSTTPTCPSCTYCRPQVASIGLTEAKAKENGREVTVGKFPFTASGKAVALGETDGFVKVVADKATGEILGVHIVGPRGDGDHPRVRGGPHAGGDARGDHAHDPRPPDAVGGRARSHARPRSARRFTSELRWGPRHGPQAPQPSSRPGEPGRSSVSLGAARREVDAVDWGMPTDMSFPLTPEQEALRTRARELADTVFAERAARWDAARGVPVGQRQGPRRGRLHGHDDAARVTAAGSGRCSTWCS